MKQKRADSPLCVCRYGRAASNYDLVMAAARRYWNASLPLMTHPIERELLQEPVMFILQYIAETMDKSKFKKLQVCC